MMKTLIIKKTHYCRMITRQHFIIEQTGNSRNSTLDSCILH